MSWVAITMDPDDNKVKIDLIYQRKIALSTIRGDQFLYILLEIGYKYSVDCYNISLSILQSSSLRVSLLFYIIFSFHLYPPHVN